MKILFAPEGPGSSPAAPAAASPAAPSPAPSAPTPSPSPAPAAAPSAPSSPSEPSSNSSLIPPDVLAIFEHDPFSQPANPTAPSAAAPNPADPTGGTPPSPPAPQAPQPAANPDLSGLQSQVAVLTDAVLRAQPAAPANPQNQPPDVPLPAHGYSFTIPEQLVAAIASENPAERGQALGALIQGVARNVHQEAIRQMRAEVMRVVPQLIQRDISASSQAQAVATDFYTAHPDLNHPAIKQLVGTVGPQVAQRLGAQGYTPQLRDAIATEVRNILASVRTQGALPPSPAAPAAPAILNGGARPSAPATNDIVDTLFG